MKYCHIDIFFVQVKVHTIAFLWVSILFSVTQSRSHDDITHKIVIVYESPITDLHINIRPATHPDLIGISQFFSTNLGVSQFPNSTCGNPEFLFRFGIGKTKGHLTLLHG